MKILQGEEFSNLFTIISDDGVTGEVLSSSDSGKMKISTVGDNATCIIDYISMTQEDANNGIFKVTIPASETRKLSSTVGFPEDKYKSMENYKATMVFTLASRPTSIIVENMISVVGGTECQIS